MLLYNSYILLAHIKFSAYAAFSVVVICHIIPACNIFTFIHSPWTSAKKPWKMSCTVRLWSGPRDGNRVKSFIKAGKLAVLPGSSLSMWASWAMHPVLLSEHIPVLLLFLYVFFGFYWLMGSKYELWPRWKARWRGQIYTNHNDDITGNSSHMILLCCAIIDGLLRNFIV